MKRLKEHVILYDAVCPMCNLYTKGFIKAGMLDQNGRLPYQELPDNFACSVDRSRFVNEIALVNTATGRVYYGVESLLQIIGHSFPKFASLFRFKPLFKMADKLYKFVSFNRRVIVPSKKDKVESGLLDPTFHKAYRSAYLVVTLLFTALILSIYSRYFGDILPSGDFYREFVVCGGQLLWQATAMRLVAREKTWDYLGNMMTISFAGALMLLLLVKVGSTFQWQNPLVYAAFFGVVVLLMFLEHIRRTRLLGLGWQMTASWVLYRIVVLLILSILFYVG